MRPLLAFEPRAGQAQISAALTLRNQDLILDYRLDQGVDPIVNGLSPLATTRDAFQREDNLWKTTCFEAFWACDDSESYYEVNFAANLAHELAPNLARWNLYRFDAYRTPQPPMQSDDWALVKVTTTHNSFSAHLKSKRTSLQPQSFNLCAVVSTREANDYYALNQHKPNADFHWREGFLPCYR